ncbi:redox-sensitive transcriptional activator SoxR [Altericroceibacterium spongiae]|uniref:Redox-sensitive transcriptional activator SoxR n=1 Tax=Altericroceibacterium spongiae TaxID=2320269 RepID=A0A420EK10_9SPHN|nr:redox-sensitive transcriptional activator SoxR [Altericroceibacterium spongiae]RKF21013.1 redox-sensitive transcriptional activator SoxR [Altericroceibacterium spongiae]
MTTKTEGDRTIPIGMLARRTGVAVSAIRFYEEKGLVRSFRSAGNQRRFLRSDIRRISFILIAQKLGLELKEIERELASLPQGRTPTVKDWAQISSHLRARIDDQMALLSQTRERLDQCIGCGCLSLTKCQLFNPGDRAADQGPGPHVDLEPA